MSGADLPMVSIVIPMRNEEKYIGKCLQSILENNYPLKKMEILLIDGISEDATREMAEGYTQRYPFIRLLDNHRKITPVAMNMGIKHARGKIIMRIDAHTTYEKDYISKCVKYLNEYNADNVGGIIRIIPRENTLVGKCIALASSHPFGGGNAYYRVGSKESRWVDTVPFGCYRREVFQKVGLYNENLVRSQDVEFNLRLIRKGGKILLHPEIVSYYHIRSNLKAILKHRFADGIWAIYPLKFVRMPLSWRHYVPFTFVLSLIGSIILFPLSPFFLWLFLFIVGSYSVANIYFSCRVAFSQRDFRYLLVMLAIFATLHISYGLGSIWGAIKLLFPIENSSSL